MVKDMMYSTPGYTLMNSGSAYTVYHEKKSWFGVSALIRTAGGMWVVANGLKASAVQDGVSVGSWAHGHYFMESKEAAVRYYEKIN